MSAGRAGRRGVGSSAGSIGTSSPRSTHSSQMSGGSSGGSSSSRSRSREMGPATTEHVSGHSSRSQGRSPAMQDIGSGDGSSRRQGISDLTSRPHATGDAGTHPSLNYASKSSGKAVRIVDPSAEVDYSDEVDELDDDEQYYEEDSEEGDYYDTPPSGDEEMYDSSSEYEEVEMEVEVVVDDSGKELAEFGTTEEDAGEADLPEMQYAEEIFEEFLGKLMKSYEVMNELIEEQKSRTFDLFRFLNDETKAESVMALVEERNDTLMQSIHREFRLGDSPETAESDAQWEVYNSIVKNFNEYLEAVAEFLSTMEDERGEMKAVSFERDQWEERSHMLADKAGMDLSMLPPIKKTATSRTYTDPEDAPSMTEEEIDELQEILLKQCETLANESEKNRELETALQSILNEYTSRISATNGQISDLHKQLEEQDKVHSEQLTEMQRVYEERLRTVEEQSGNKYKKEIEAMMESLTDTRGDVADETRRLADQLKDSQLKALKDREQFDEEIGDLKMSLAQARADRSEAEMEVARFRKQLEGVSDEMMAFRKQVKLEYDNRKVDELNVIVDSLQKVNTKIDIDVEDEWKYAVIKRGGGGSGSGTSGHRSREGGREGSRGTTRIGQGARSTVVLGDGMPAVEAAMKYAKTPSQPASHAPREAAAVSGAGAAGVISPKSRTGPATMGSLTSSYGLKSSFHQLPVHSVGSSRHRSKSPEGRGAGLGSAKEAYYASKGSRTAGESSGHHSGSGHRRRKDRSGPAVGGSDELRSRGDSGRSKGHHSGGGTRGTKSAKTFRPRTSQF